jgi:EAL domain-containing protein (putative c-di-GMP-specific phosphodiesterase class I)
VSPPEAIQAAERQGWIAELGLRILNQALADIARIPPEQRVRVGVNLSGEQLRPASVERIIERITASGLSRWLWLEITEQALVENRSFVAQSLEGLRNSGVVIAIDDFGTGYCGLDYLCTLPVDVVKLDGIFAREAVGSLTRRRVVQLGVQLAQAVGAVALAEGIEHDEVATLMRDLGCTYGQGYAFSRPLPRLSMITPAGFPAPVVEA